MTVKDTLNYSQTYFINENLILIPTVEKFQGAIFINFHWQNMCTCGHWQVYYLTKMMKNKYFLIYGYKTMSIILFSTINTEIYV